MDFSARHIGPSPAEQQQMLAAVGYSSLDELTAAALPPALASTGADPLDLPGPALGGGGGGRAAPAGGQEHGGDVHDRARLLPDHHPGRDPPQRAGEPRLVHRLHALPAGDLAGAAGGPAELPDDGRRPDRAAGGGRVPAGRGERRRRGDDPGPPGGGQGQHLPRRRGLPAADAGGPGHPRRAARHRAGRGAPHPGAGGGPAGRGAVRRAAALPRGQRRDHRPAARSSPPPAPGGRWSRSPPTCSR